MKQIFILLLLAVFVVGCASNRPETGAPGSSSQSTTGGSTAKAADDSSFARDARASAIAEVEMGKLAAKNTTNEAVHNLGKKIVDEHTQANGELERILASKAMLTQTEPNQTQKGSWDKLAALKDGEFDQAFKQQLIQDHEKAIQSFEKQAQQGADVELRMFAQKYLPHLREHLTMAQQLEAGNQTQTPVDDTSEQIKPTTPPDTAVPK